MHLGDLGRLGGADVAKRTGEMERELRATARLCSGDVVEGKVTRRKTGRAWLGEAVAIATAILQQWCDGRYRYTSVGRH